jgi:uncharacterized protein
MQQETQFFKFDNNFIAYKEYKSKRKDAPTIVFHHGLMSDMEGKKALFIEQYCIDNDLSCIRFDNFGHGQSSGKFTEQTIGSWINGFRQVLDNVISGDVIIVGSSMGGWISLSIAENYKDHLKGLLLLAPAPDFTETLIWGKMTKQEQEYMVKEGVFEFGDADCKYPISYNLIKESKEHLIFNGKKLDFDFPVHIIQGKQDEEVPYKTALKLLEIISAPQTTLKLLENSRHNLSSEEELIVIGKSLGEIMS